MRSWRPLFQVEECVDDFNLQLERGPHKKTVRPKLIQIESKSRNNRASPKRVAEIGLKLKQDSPFGHTFTIELANDSRGYLPTPEQHALGGYETWMGTNRVEKQASVKITKTLLKMLESLKN